MLCTWARVGERVPEITMRPAEVNGRPGAVFYDGADQVLGVWAIDIVDGAITQVSSIVNPDKLSPPGARRRLRRGAPLGPLIGHIGRPAAPLPRRPAATPPRHGRSAAYGRVCDGGQTR